MSRDHAANGYASETRKLTRESLALWVNSLLTAVLGLGFWFVAGRRYSAANVGRDGTLVNALMPLSMVAQFNLGAALAYLLPGAGTHGASSPTSTAWPARRRSWRVRCS